MAKLRHGSEEGNLSSARLPASTAWRAARYIPTRTVTQVEREIYRVIDMLDEAI